VLLLQNSSNLNLVWLCLRRNRYGARYNLPGCYLKKSSRKIDSKINKKCPIVIPWFDVVKTEGLPCVQCSYPTALFCCTYQCKVCTQWRALFSKKKQKNPLIVTIAIPKIWLKFQQQCKMPNRFLKRRCCCYTYRNCIWFSRKYL
jgi:hypothetical protein